MLVEDFNASSSTSSDFLSIGLSVIGLIALSWIVSEMRLVGFDQKRCGLLDVDGFFDPLVAFLDGAVTAGLLSPSSRRLLSVATDPDALLVDVLS